MVPSKGSVRVFLIPSLPLHQPIKKLSDSKASWSSVSIAENQIFEETVLKDVAFGPQNFEFEEEAKKIAREKLALVGIDESPFERSPFELSGGQ